jgi:PIN domain nuclease of toxin-antitoxin system
LILIDTHVLAWMVWNEPIAPAARATLAAASPARKLFVSAVSAWEFGVLTAKNRLSLDEPLESWWRDAINSTGLVELPLDSQAARESTRLPGTFHADPADRFLVATARVHDLTLATADKHILAYAKAGHVKALRAR